MDTTKALIITSSVAITLTRDTDGLRLGALILSTLDRLGVAGQVISRGVIYCHRVAVFELPGLDYGLASVLVERCALGLRLAGLIRVQHTLMLAQRPTGGSVFIIDLVTSNDRA